jgi:hypothetical protein
MVRTASAVALTGIALAIMLSGSSAHVQDKAACHRFTAIP